MALRVDISSMSNTYMGFEKFSQLDNLDWEVDLFIPQLHNGDIGALMSIGDYFGHSLKMYATDLVKDENVAGQIITEILTKVWKSREHIEDSLQLIAFLYLEVSKRSLTQLTLQKAFHAGITGSACPPDHPEPPPDVTQLVRLAEWARFTRLALRSPAVPRAYRDLARVILSQRTFSEITSAHNVTADTIAGVVIDITQFYERQSPKISAVANIVQSMLNGVY